MSDLLKKAPAANNVVQMGRHVGNVAQHGRTAANGMNPATGLAPWLAPLALWGGGSNIGEGIGKMATGDVAGGALQTAGGVGAATAGGIGTAGLLAGWLAPGGALATAVGGGTTAAAGGAGLATTVGAAGALPIAATVGGGLAAGLAIGSGMNAIADSETNAFHDDQGRGTDDRMMDWYINRVQEDGGDPTSIGNVIVGGTLGTVGQIADVAGGIIGGIGSLFD